MAEWLRSALSAREQRGGSCKAHRILEASEIEVRVAALNATAAVPWTLRNGKLCKEFKFRDFVEAFGFMTQAALVAERSNHHPEWFNVYNTVRVELVTHDVKGISERDFALARAMESMVRMPSA